MIPGLRRMLLALVLLVGLLPFLLVVDLLAVTGSKWEAGLWLGIGLGLSAQILVVTALTDSAEHLLRHEPYTLKRRKTRPVDWKTKRPVELLGQLISFSLCLALGAPLLLALLLTYPVSLLTGELNKLLLSSYRARLKRAAQNARARGIV